MSPRLPVRRATYALLALGLTGAVVAVPPAGAAAQAFSGFSISAVSTPLQIDIYEPTVPLPASPQLELEVGYSKAWAESGGSRGRASLLWPGDVVGEGLKTIVDASGLPKELGENGYPVQANSSYPDGKASDSQEPFPGAVMKTSASAAVTEAQAGYSGDCEVRDANPTAPAKCALPGDLAAVADVAGSSSVTRVENTGRTVLATAEAAADDVSLLSGLITVAGLSSQSVSTSDGKQAKGDARASYAGLKLAGQVVRLGPDGAALAGQSLNLPGLPTDPNAALSQLGIRLTVPTPSYDRQGALLTSTVSALVVDVDTTVLRSKLDALPWATVSDVIVGLPDELGHIKQALGAALYLAPRFVFTLAKSQSSVNTVQGITVPLLPTDPGLPDAGVGNPASSGSVGGNIGAPSVGGAPGPLVSAPDAAPLVSAVQAAGLPERYTLPGLLVLGALAAAALLATWLRGLSALLLGTRTLCPHGLDSGLPDLRKA